MSIVTGLMLFFTAVTFAAAFWFVARVVPKTLQRRSERQIDMHGEALIALAGALSRPQPAEHEARLAANYAAHRTALLTLKPDATVPAPKTAGVKLAA